MVRAAFLLGGIITLSAAAAHTICRIKHKR
jgi:hypothetical protein